MRFEMSLMELGLVRWFLGRRIDRVVHDSDWRVHLISDGEGVEFTPLDFASSDVHHPDAAISRVFAERPDAVLESPVMVESFGVVRDAAVLTVGVSFSLPRSAGPTRVLGVPLPAGTEYGIVYSDPYGRRPDVRIVDVGVLFTTDHGGLLLHTDGATDWLHASLDPDTVIRRVFGGHERLARVT
jgi:hypothetical protein